MEAKLLEKICEELNEELRGAFISKIHQTDEQTLLIKFFMRGSTDILLISTDANFSRMHLTLVKRENPPRPPRFCELLRSRIEGARVLSFNAKDGERIASIKLLKGKEREEFEVRVELLGKSSNIILLDKDKVVVDALRRFSGDGEKRKVVAGVQLAELEKPKDRSPQNKEEVQREGSESLSVAIERYYTTLTTEDSFQRASSEVGRELKGIKKKIKRLIGNLKEDKKKAEAAIEERFFGELILANFRLIKKGMKAVELLDYRTPEQKKISIPLDPSKTPEENVDKFYKKAKKAKVTGLLLLKRIPKEEGRLVELEKIQMQLEELKNKEEVEALRRTAEQAGFLRTKRIISKGDKVRGAKTAEPFVRGKTSEGFEYRFGKTGRGNDLLVKEYAKPGDLWFHANGVAGAHAVLKTKGRTKPPTEKAIFEVAKVAAVNSKAGRSLKVEVIYTDAKFVTKPKGAKPGTVKVSEFRTVFVKSGEKD
ncbi:MAG: DUF814 domain-containing protein [Deltaproteobacteria bacterium]|nr:DUF814 domain-containing protein [Deltaproteobacteria bacterium]